MIPITSESDQFVAAGEKLYLESSMARAEGCFIRATELDPNNANAWASLGLIWNLHEAYEDAEKCLLKALALDPKHPTALINLGVFFENVGRDDRAIQCYEKCIAETGSARASVNLAWLRLKAFDFAAGWQLAEQRFWTNPKMSVPREYAHMPLWDGEPTKKLAIWGEQGIGDQIMYATLLEELESEGQLYEVQLDARLLPMYQRDKGVDEYFGTFTNSGEFKDCTAHIPLMSLARIFRPTLRSFIDCRSMSPFADPKRVAEYLPLPGFGPKKKRIAISWCSLQPEHNRHIRIRKSAPLEVFDPLTQREDVSLVSVQYGPMERQITDAALRGAFIEVVPGLDLIQDIDGIIAVIEGCDAVVTTSNVTAHFAGALGKTTYLICKDKPALFYHHTPDGQHLWYPNTTVICEPSWEQCIAKVMEAI